MVRLLGDDSRRQTTDLTTDLAPQRDVYGSWAESSRKVWAAPPSYSIRLRVVLGFFKRCALLRVVLGFYARVARC